MHAAVFLANTTVTLEIPEWCRTFQHASRTYCEHKHSRMFHVVVWTMNHSITNNCDQGVSVPFVTVVFIAASNLVQSKSPPMWSLAHFCLGERMCSPSSSSTSFLNATFTCTSIVPHLRKLSCHLSVVVHLLHGVSWVISFTKSYVHCPPETSPLWNTTWSPLHNSPSQQHLIEGFTIFW